MGTLCFVCPTNGREVDTGIEVDNVSFTTLYAEQLGCPECLEVHEVSRIDAWVTDEAHPIRRQDEAVGGGG
jgi:hypothetical protein